MTQVVIGIDISKQTFDVAWLEGSRCESFKLSNNPSGFRKLLKKLEGTQAHVCMEATALHWAPLANALYKAQHRVSVVNPLAIRRYGESKLRRHKTDKADARLIAEFCAREHPRLWHAPEPEYAQLKELFRRREQLLKARQAETNRLGAGYTVPAVLKSFRRNIRSLRTELALVEKQMYEHIQENARLRQQFKLLLTIPGIGAIGASAILAEIGDPTRFEHAKQMASFAGLTPKEHSSGTSVRGSNGISKMGSSYLRRVLYMAAIVAKNHNPVVKDFCQRLLDHNKSEKLVVVAAMRKLLHLAFGVLKNNQAFAA